MANTGEVTEAVAAAVADAVVDAVAEAVVEAGRVKAVGLSPRPKDKSFPPIGCGQLTGVQFATCGASEVREATLGEGGRGHL